jgi:GNAT superfamily N-acetyltransferase
MSNATGTRGGWWPEESKVDVTVREAARPDVPEICGLVRELAAYEQLSDAVVSNDAMFDQALFGEDSVARALVAEDGGEIVGLALWFPTFSTFLGRSGIWLEDLFVKPSARGNGHGRALLEALRAKTDGRLEWSVLDWNESAQGFYRRLGAEPLDGWTTWRWPPAG